MLNLLGGGPRRKSSLPDSSPLLSSRAIAILSSHGILCPHHFSPCKIINHPLLSVSFSPHSRCRVDVAPARALGPNLAAPADTPAGLFRTRATTSGDSPATDQKHPNTCGHVCRTPCCALQGLLLSHIRLSVANRHSETLHWFAALTILTPSWLVFLH